MVQIKNISNVWKYIVAYTLSISTFNGNQYTTHKSTYKKKIVSEINDAEEIFEGTFSIKTQYHEIGYIIKKMSAFFS